MQQDKTPEERDFYYPREVAERLGISVEMLAYLRRTGKIQGRFLGNITVYTDEQIAAADLTPSTRGPKVGKRRGANKQQRDNDNDTSLKHRWRICDTGGSSTQESRQAVGA